MEEIQSHSPGKKVLCQECLRVRPYTSERNNGTELCICGGIFCGCSFCFQIINRLKSGCTEGFDFLNSYDIEFWTEDFGTDDEAYCKARHLGLLK